MTQAELEQLSRDVAERYEIEAYIFNFVPMVHVFGMNSNHTEGYDQRVWLHDDIGRCATLAIEHSLNTAIDDDAVSINVFGKVALLAFEYFKDHNGNKIRATCVAILKALKDKP